MARRTKATSRRGKSTRRSTPRRSTARRAARRSTARRTARRSTARKVNMTRRGTSRRSTPRRTSTARRSTARRSTARRSTARRSTPRRTSTDKRQKRNDAVVDVLEAAAGVRRGVAKPKKVVRKNTTQDDIDSFLAGIESSSSYGLKEVFKGDDKNDRVAKRGPIKKRKPTPPRIPRNRRGKIIRDEDTTGPLDPAAIKGNVIKEKKAPKKSKGAKKDSPWLDHVKAFYAEKKKQDPNYKYSQALKDAKATYKK